MKRYLIPLLLAYTQQSALAQHTETPTNPALWKGSKQVMEDTASLLHAFKAGQLHGHFRYFFMATDNESGLSDYIANAVGGGIKFETARFHGFQVGVSGFFVFNIGSSNFSKKDPLTQQGNRYEIGLFDINNPTNKKDIDRLEELYLKYNWKKSHVSIGKQLINTPFINLQDSRMRPTEVGGLYAVIKQLKNTKIEGGYIYQVSPRATVEWYSVAHSIGVYGQGVNPDGSKSNYRSNLHSKGIFLLDIEYKPSEKLRWQIHNILVDNIFNTSFIQVDLKNPLWNHGFFLLSGQYFHQQAIHDGGNPDPAKTYFTPKTASNTFGAKIGLQQRTWELTANYTRITKSGRYTMPREWGNEPLFTYQPRERSEGLGDLHAYSLKFNYQFTKARIKLHAAAGYFSLPEINNYALNKYGMPSYHQYNLDLRHDFTGHLKGLDAHLLVVYKGNANQSPTDLIYIHNKVNMYQWNMIFNYHF